MSTELLESIGETERQLEKLKEQLEESQKNNTLWKPAYNQKYVFVSAYGSVVTAKWRHPAYDADQYAVHNVFPSLAIGNKASELMRRSNLIISACLQVDPDFEPNWGNPGQGKYYAYYSQRTQSWKSNSAYEHRSAVAYVSSEEAIDKVLKILNAAGKTL